MPYPYVGGPEEYDPEPYYSEAGAFADLVEDLAELRRQREPRQAQPTLENLDQEFWTKSMREHDRVITDVSEGIQQMKQQQAEWERQDAARRAQLQERHHAADLAAHKAFCRREIPRVLAKALDLQRRGVIDALTVCKIQAETNRLAETLGL